MEIIYNKNEILLTTLRCCDKSTMKTQIINTLFVPVVKGKDILTIFINQIIRPDALMSCIYAFSMNNRLI